MANLMFNFDINENGLVSVIEWTKCDEEGVGHFSKMFNYFLEMSKDCGAKAVTLKVDKESYPAKDIYDHYGFKEIGKIGTWIYMKKKI